MLQKILILKDAVILNVLFIKEPWKEYRQSENTYR